MRLFVAVDLDSEARSAIEAARIDRLRAARDVSPIRWVQPAQMHLTLVFIGDADDARAAALVAAIDRPVRLPPFELVFGGFGVFPPRGAPRAIWIGVSEGEAGLRALQREIAGRVAGTGAPLESRPFSPHLTLGRWKQSRSSDRGRVLGGAPACALARLRIDHATLYRSQVSSQGPTYTALARANLTAGAE